MNDLLNCPFCNGESELISDADGYYVRCMCCVAEFKQATKEGAISIWNRRAIPREKILLELLGQNTESLGSEAINLLNNRPQSLTEKVNWAKGKCCSGYPNCIHNPSSTEKVKWPEKKAYDKLSEMDDCRGYTASARDKHFGHKGYNEAIDACKQSLNQVSQEDREGLIRCIVNDKEALLWTNIENGNFKPLADAILKEYILVKREESK